MPRALAFSALVMTNATAPSASIGHSIAWSGSETILEARICSTVRSLSRYIALGFIRAHLRNVTQTDAMSSAVDPLSCM